MTGAQSQGKAGGQVAGGMGRVLKARCWSVDLFYTQREVIHLNKMSDMMFG